MNGRFDGKVAFVTGGLPAWGPRRRTASPTKAPRSRSPTSTPPARRRWPRACATDTRCSSTRPTPSPSLRGVADAVEHFGRLDVVFNNAGITGTQQILHEMDVANWDRVRAVNGDGVFYVMKYAIEAMLRTGGGSIVNTSSTAGLTGQLNISPYTFAKAGIIGLTRSAAIEYAKQNVRVNAIAPTVVWTPLVRVSPSTAPDPEAMRAAMEHYNPMPGIPTAEDVAAVVAFLASDDARWITGHTVPIDGGYVAQ